MPPPSSLTTTGPDPPPPPVQCCIGAKIALPAAPHRLESGAITNFDCRCTTAATGTASSIPPPSLALAPAPRQHPRPSSRRPTSPLPLFFVFSPPAKTKKPSKVLYIALCSNNARHVGHNVNYLFFFFSSLPVREREKEKIYNTYIINIVRPRTCRMI